MRRRGVDVGVLTRACRPDIAIAPVLRWSRAIDSRGGDTVLRQSAVGARGPLVRFTFLVMSLRPVRDTAHAHEVDDR